MFPPPRGRLLVPTYGVIHVQWTRSGNVTADNTHHQPRGNQQHEARCKGGRRKNGVLASPIGLRLLAFLSWSDRTRLLGLCFVALGSPDRLCPRWANITTPRMLGRVGTLPPCLAGRGSGRASARAVVVGGLRSALAKRIPCGLGVAGEGGGGRDDERRGRLAKHKTKTTAALGETAE